MTNDGPDVDENDSLIEFSVPFPVDDDGYFDRQCAFEGCLREFKVEADDWKEKVGDTAFCPWCRHEAANTDWFTPKQSQYLQSFAEGFALGYAHEQFRLMVEEFNASRRHGGMLSVCLTHQNPELPVLVPIKAAEIMLQKLTCGSCGCRFASVGASFFCPACGVDSAPQAFRSTVEIVRRSVTSGVEALYESLDREAAADVARVIIEGAISRLVAAHQKYAEAMFQRSFGIGTKIPKNVFQRLTEASALWRDQTGTGYEDVLHATEMDQLHMLFQRRHLLEHRDGIVDAEYIAKSKDTTWREGQRLVVTPEDVLLLADLVEKIANGIEAMPGMTTVHRLGCSTTQTVSSTSRETEATLRDP